MKQKLKQLEKHFRLNGLVSLLAHPVACSYIRFQSRSEFLENTKFIGNVENVFVRILEYKDLLHFRQQNIFGFSFAVMYAMNLVRD